MASTKKSLAPSTSLRPKTKAEVIAKKNIGTNPKTGSSRGVDPKPLVPASILNLPVSEIQRLLKTARSSKRIETLSLALRIKAMDKKKNPKSKRPRAKPINIGSNPKTGSTRGVPFNLRDKK